MYYVIDEEGNKQPLPATMSATATERNIKPYIIDGFLIAMSIVFFIRFLVGG